MLSLELEFLTGRYFATSFDDRGRAEWPPHPARLFSALAAAHLDEAEPPSEERAALVWLESLGPPEIAASEAVERLAVTHFVPVNDTSVVGSFDDLATSLAEARQELEAAKSKGTKAVSASERKVAKAQKRLDEAVAKATAAMEPGKESKEGPAKAASLLPERRLRQPRTFPSVAPVDPRVVFSWPDAEPSPQQSAALDGLAARVVRLGHSASLVALRVASPENRGGANWLPDRGDAGRGREDAVLRVVEPGQLDALRAAFEQQGDAPGRVLPATFHRYVRPTAAPGLLEPRSSVFGEDWIVLRRVAGPRLPSGRAVDVARTLRKALLEAAGPGAPEILSGHGPSGERSEVPHAAYVPLPYVGSQHADGAILGAAVIVPREVEPGERLAVYRAFAEWERRRSSNPDELARLPLFLGRLGELGLVRLEQELPQTLRPETWCHPSRSWASATPVALDRNPGDLHSKDPRKEAAAYAEAERTLATACEQIGLPRPQRVTVVPAAPLVGAEKARRFPPFATGKPPVQRVLVHSVIHFEAPVRGPILLGAGRYFGLGLFRPLRS